MGDNPYLDEAQSYDSKEEYLDASFIKPSDQPDGIELIPEWTDEYPEEAPNITNAKQMGTDKIEYDYKGYHVQIRRSATVEYEVRVFIDEYSDVDFVRQNHYITGPAYISKVTDGVIYVTVNQFIAHHAYEAARELIDQYVDYVDGQDQLTEALGSFDD